MCHAVAGLPSASCAISHTGLTSLNLTGCDALVGSIRCSSLQRLSLSSSNIQRLPGIAACPALISLDVRGCKKLQDSSIRAALPGLTGLQELTMGQGVPVTDDTVREVSLTWV
jgi:Leucine-rich repeat (LRR) protein